MSQLINILAKIKQKNPKIQSRGEGPVPMHTADDRFLLECIWALEYTVLELFSIL